MQRSKIALTLLMTTALGIGLAGCGAATATPPPNAAPRQSEIAAPSAEPTKTLPATNTNGNLEKAIGEDGAVVFAGGEENAFTFKVTNIEVNPDCTGDGSFKVPSKNGEFVALTFEITTSADYLKVMSGGEPLRLFWQDWKGYSATGTVVENGPNGLTCFARDESMPLDIPAGTTSTGKFVLDLDPSAASVGWSPSYVRGQDKSGWEWAIPQ
ncbi:hypothetical protein [Subtercola sp. Z020]|uniref:hypothetical protein n=1 Tax=Subtercola sp. Z020 TaxID=2080582 RepID=UPI0011B0B787|nr:hypothetical protein [Subtercola sp. Z020]